MTRPHAAARRQPQFTPLARPITISTTGAAASRRLLRANATTSSHAPLACTDRRVTSHSAATDPVHSAITPPLVGPPLLAVARAPRAHSPLAELPPYHGYKRASDVPRSDSHLRNHLPLPLELPSAAAHSRHHPSPPATAEPPLHAITTQGRQGNRTPLPSSLFCPIFRPSLSAGSPAIATGRPAQAASTPPLCSESRGRKEMAIWPRTPWTSPLFPPSPLLSILSLSFFQIRPYPLNYTTKTTLSLYN
jgi:hypothetical protein